MSTYYEIRQSRRAGDISEVPPMPGWGEISKIALENKTDSNSKQNFLICKRCHHPTPRHETVKVGKSKSYYLCTPCFKSRIVKTKEFKNA